MDTLNNNTLAEAQFEQELSVLAGDEASAMQIEHLLRFAELGKMSAGVVHDFNNDLTVAMGYLALLLHDRGLKESQKKLLKVASERLGESGKMLQALFRMIRGGAPTREKASLSEILEHIKDKIMVNQGFLKSDIRIILDYKEPLPLVWMDPLQIERVFFNLIQNAVNVMQETGTGNTVWVNVRSARDKVVILIRDSGPGLPESVLLQLGKPFCSTRKDHGGTGLGLMVAVQIIKEHGGEIKARNHSEFGAEFLIELPVKASPAEPVDSPNARFPSLVK